MNKYIIYLLLFFMFLPGFTVLAQEETALAKEKIELRIPDKEKIEKYKNDKKFQYEADKPIGTPRWLQKIVEDIKDFFKDVDPEKWDTFFRWAKLIFIVAFLTAIIAFIALKTQNISVKSLFGKRKMETEDAEFIAEDVNKIDFDQLISENLKTKNYRLVIRFLYLKNLKALSDRSIIHWNPNKTNYSYQYEIENKQLRNRFLDTTRIFDFVWYGEFLLDDGNFQDAYNYFNEFNQMISHER